MILSTNKNIKQTPKIRTILTLGLAALSYISASSALAACNKVFTDLSPKATEARLAPIGKVTVVADAEPASNAPLGPDAGKTRYAANCAMCHATGLAGAPKFGDKAAWAPRVKLGVPELLKVVTKGLNAMPPRGGCTTCSDEELKLTIEYMIEQVK